MKAFISDFIRRGMIACSLGPVVLAVLYLILQRTADVETLTVNQVCTGIFSITLLAFIAGGMNAVYQLERLPLMAAVFLHGTVLYLSYLATYVINGWLGRGIRPILFFTGIFVVCYLIIWLIIYCVNRKNTARLNEKLEESRRKTNTVDF